MIGGTGDQGWMRRCGLDCSDGWASGERETIAVP